MLDDERKEIALVVLRQLEQGTDSYLTTLDGEPFLILGGWADLSYFNDNLNERLNPRAWAEWRPFYVALNKIKSEEDRWPRRPFEQIRLGKLNAEKLYKDSWRLEKKWDMLAAHKLVKEMVELHPWLTNHWYDTPDGLIELDEVVELGFSDEYDSCGNCGKAIRTQPDGHGRLLMADETEEGYLCPECLDPAEYLEARVNHNKLVNDRLVDPADHGWQQREIRYENGFHPGQDDDPKSIIPKLNAEGYDVLFTGFPSQFQIDFWAWVRPMQGDEEE